MKIENDSQLLSEFNKAYERGSLKLCEKRRLLYNESNHYY